MKKVIITGVVLIVGVAVVLFYPRTNEYVREVVEVEKVVTLNEKDARVNEAQESARADVEAKAQQAYQSAYDHEMNVIKEKVLLEYRKEIDAELTETQKQNKTY